jgi:hypothetical protein
MERYLQGTRTGCDARSTGVKTQLLQGVKGMANASSFLHLPPRPMDQAFSCRTVTAFAEPFLSAHRKPA